MKTKSLLATLLVTIILLSSCVLGVAENESASVSFKINKTSIAEQRTSISRQDTDGGSNEESYIIVSIIDAATEEVIASQELSGEAKSAAFEIQIGLTIIGKIEFYVRSGDATPHLLETYISAPYTVTEGQNNIVAYDDNAEVYLNPISDSSDGTGTEDFPVSTIASAVKLLPRGGTIWVMSPIEVNTTETWNYSNNITLKRYSDDGALINVNNGGNLTLENLVIDGQRERVAADAQLIIIQEGGTLQLSNGATVQNNTGGGIANLGTFNITGGTVQNNTGGGIANVGTFNITGGTITNNTAEKGGEAGAGGVLNIGIITFNSGGIINISGNTIKNIPNNIAYTNDANGDIFPVQVLGTLSNETTIGLSPYYINPNAILVQATDASYLNVSHFSLDAGGKIEKLEKSLVSADQTGDIGPGGGRVFFYDRKRYEVSNNLGKMNWDAAIKKGEDYTNNGFDNWKLPNKEELNAVYTNLIPNHITDDDSFWSSSESNNNNAWIQYFTNGEQTASDKANNINVLVVRSF